MAWDPLSLQCALWWQWWETGKQAKLLNWMLEENPFKLKLNEISGEVLQETLKEYVGHTPLQVAAGAILGVGIAFLMNLQYA